MSGRKIRPQALSDPGSFLGQTIRRDSFDVCVPARPDPFAAVACNPIVRSWTIMNGSQGLIAQMGTTAWRGRRFPPPRRVVR